MKIRDIVVESRDADAKQVLDYIHGTHHEPLTTQLQQAVLSYPHWELRSVPLSSLHIPDQEYDDEDQEPEEDPYNRVQAIDPDHAGEYSANFVDRRPIVVDGEGWIIDGNHRAWAAAELLNRSTIQAWVPASQLNELGNAPAEYKPNRQRKRSLFHATVDNHWVDVFFDRSEFNDTLHITFAVNGNYDTPSQSTSASRSTVKILSTVLNIVKKQLPEYMTKARPPAVSFTAKGDNRATLYRRYFVPVIQDIMGPKWQHEEYTSMGMTVFHWRPAKKQNVREESVNPANTLYFFDVAKSGRSFDHLDLRIMGLKQSQKGRWYWQPGRDSTDLLTTATLKHLEKTLNVPARPWQRPTTESRIIDPERVDVYYRPVPNSRGRRVVARNIPAATLEPLLKKLSEKYSVPVKSFEWTPAEPMTEAFDQPYAVEWSKQNGDWHATANLDDGSELIVLFMSQGDNNWMVEFERDENMEITGEGDAPRVFATVLAAMQQFIAKRKPVMLNFSAEKEDDPTGSRARLYDRMVQRYVSGTGYDLTRKDVPGGATYTLTKQAPGVAEGKVKLFTDPSYFGAEVDDTGFDSLPVVNISADRLVGFEPDDKMNQSKSKANVEKIVAGLKQGAKLPPLLVRKYKDGYQVLDGHHRFWAYKLLGTKSIPSRIVPDKDIEEISKQSVAESVNDYLWHGSRNKHDVLYPHQAVDTGGKEESNKNAVYATPNAKFAIAMGLTTPGSDNAMFPNDPQMVLFKGGIRKGEMVYLHKVPKDLFIKHNSREWYSKPDVKEIKPIDVVTVPVDKWLHLIRQATPKDFELRKKYMKKQGVAEGLNESAIFLNPNAVIVGQQHGKPLDLSPETLKQVQAIAAKHGAWYEGNGADRAYTRGVIDRYVGSFDDEVAKTASPDDPKWIYVLFANVDANNRVQRVGVDPEQTIFDRLMATAKDNSFQGIGYTEEALKKFLSMCSEGKYDFVAMSQQPATKPNLTRFLKAGEALMWPSNWDQYPNKAGKIARAATVLARDQYLASRRAGVYVVGSGHLKAVQDISGKQGIAEGLDDNGISFQVQKGKNKFATTLSMGNNPVGVYQYNATTGRSIAEVYPEFKGKGLGKLLVLHAIYTATQLGLDFQEDESRTSEYDNVLDSLSSNGYIVDDDGYWYVTGEGEQYLQHSLKQGVAEGHADQKQLDPELYEELPAGFLRGIVARVLPAVPLKFKTTPEGYLSVRATDGSVRLDIGMSIAGGDIGFNVENAYLTGHQGTGVMTQIVTDAYETVEREYGQPQSRSLNVMQDRGHGVWQAIANKVGAEYGAHSQMGESAEQDVEENFADGKNPGRKGLAKRSGVNTKASVTSLRKTAKHSSGEKQRMAHWLANMKAGRAKARKK